ncbi:hypothetical protein SAMD00019534_110010 [Acytostelium subglobosum LB1]|uniref:hypothetical protein n=1 Tax=Acytostelium subglobosum LB1 TaxID=1410327 RepID=UPI0006451852|nr:hypothetical protein SAMD00019534_110010 [Acytostelium subglobosum LB1]GAM27825.1 hypothetical protein SAMD00019534_110010 [Acytostelium subglobosum LB1]|eukprot:XP_012749108.1 hypothetical protein SAMD00019534_110010 [Acytostelium subglobosum LB1]
MRGYVCEATTTKKLSQVKKETKPSTMKRKRTTTTTTTTSTNDKEDVKMKIEDEQEQIQQEQEHDEPTEKKIIKKKATFQLTLATRFINTMASTFIATCPSNARVRSDRLRSFYIESVQQVKNLEIKELLFKLAAWDKFFHLVKNALNVIETTVSKDNSHNDDADSSDQADADQIVNGDDDTTEQQEKERPYKLVKSINHIIRSQCIGGEESITSMLQEKTHDASIDILYKQSALQAVPTDSSMAIVRNHFIPSKSNVLEQLNKIIVISTTSTKSDSLKYIDVIAKLLSSINYNDAKIVEQAYGSLAKYLRMVVLPNIEQRENKDYETGFVSLAREVLKITLALSAVDAKRSFDTDYTVVMSLLGHTRFLGKLTTILNEFDFSNTTSPHYVSQSNGIIPLLITKFMASSDLTPPTSAIAYLRSRILYEKATKLFTITRDDLRLKVKIASTSLQPPQSLVTYLTKNPQLLSLSHPKADLTKAIRTITLDRIEKILEDIMQHKDDVENKEEDTETTSSSNQFEDGIIINKTGARSAAEDEQDEEDDEEENEEESALPTEQSSKLLQSLLEGLSDDEEEEDDE